MVLSIYEDDEGTFCLGTEHDLVQDKRGADPNEHVHERFPRPRVSDGLPTFANVHTLVRDRLGRIWVCSRRGLCTLIEGQLTEVSDGIRRQGVTEIEFARDGSIFVSDAWRSYRAPDGKHFEHVLDQRHVLLVGRFRGRDASGTLIQFGVGSLPARYRGLEAESEESVTVGVAPRWFETAWFYLCAAMLLLGMSLLATQTFTQSVRRRNKQLRQEFDERKIMKAKLRRSESRFRDLAESTHAIPVEAKADRFQFAFEALKRGRVDHAQAVDRDSQPGNSGQIEPWPLLFRRELLDFGAP